MSKICNSCGKEVKDEFDFCVYCGKELPKHYICPDCREEYLEIDYEYCGKCGGKLVPFDSINETISNLNLKNLSSEEICEVFWSEFEKEFNKAENKFSLLLYETDRRWNSFGMEGIDPWDACHLSTRFYFGRYNDTVEIKIYIGKNKPLYDHLFKRKDYYDKQFPYELVWIKKSIACNISLKLHLSIWKKSDWEEIIHQFIDQMNKFCEVFSKDIKKFTD